jgi:hypothetical protein
VNPSTGTPAKFWDAMTAYLDEVLWRDAPPDARPGRSIPRRSLRRTDDAPRRMLRRLDRWEYPVDDTLARLRRLRSAP